MKSLPNCQMYRFVKSSQDATATAKPTYVRVSRRKTPNSVYSVKKSTRSVNC